MGVQRPAARPHQQPSAEQRAALAAHARMSPPPPPLPLAPTSARHPKPSPPCVLLLRSCLLPHQSIRPRHAAHRRHPHDPFRASFSFLSFFLRPKTNEPKKQ